MHKYFFTLTVSLLFPTITVAEIVGLDCTLNETFKRNGWKYKKMEEPITLKFDVDTTKEVIHTLYNKSENVEDTYNANLTPSSLTWEYEDPEEETESYFFKKYYVLIDRDTLSIGRRWTKLSPKKAENGAHSGSCEVVERKRKNKF